jgi:D-amino-acid dehydrogenase
VRIIVLGAGVIGVTSAWYLAGDGHEVTVVDREPEPARETSFANGGQISAGHAEPWARPGVLPKVLKWLGKEDAPLLFRPRADPAQWLWGLRFALQCTPARFERNCRALATLSSFSRECLGRLRETTGIRYDALTRGILHFCSAQRDFEELARHAESMRALGIPRQVKTAVECLALEPALRESRVPIAGGVYTPQDESGDARTFTRELARLCAQKGVAFRFRESIEAIQAKSGEVEGIRLEGETIKADAYVVALGSYSPLMLKPLGVHVPVYPLKGYSITVPVEGDEAPTVSLTDEAVKVVISRLGNRLRAAGTAELTGYDTAINSVRCDAILSRIRLLFPGVRSESVERWAGLRPATPNNVPVIRRTQYRNLFLNTGHGTLGWTLACGSGRVLADLVSGREPPVDIRPYA